jgi:hypothetical protein
MKSLVSLTKPLIVRVSLATMLAVAGTLLGFPLSSAHAYTHYLNNYDSNPHDFLCGTSTTSPCLAWFQPYHQSITLYAYFDPVLKTATGQFGAGPYDFTVAINQAFTNWNKQQAWNPYLVSCGSSTSCEASANVAYGMADLGPGTWGYTDVLDFYGTVSCFNTPASTTTCNGSPGYWYAAYYYVPVYFNSTFAWDSNMQWGTREGDGITVATHETGHLLGLGHTGHSPAIMRQGPLNYESVQPDDFNGLWSIYPGYYPSGNQ